MKVFNLSISVLSAVFLTLFSQSTSFALSARVNPREAIGAPGVPHSWAPALKQAVGTSFEEKSGRQTRSPVWFTIAEGIVTEVYYPSVDRPQLGDIQFIVTDGTSFFSDQKTGCTSTVKFLDQNENPKARVLIQGVDRQNRYRFEQTIVTDADAPVLRIQTKFKFNRSNLKVFALVKPSIDNSGGNDLAWTSQKALYATEKARGTRIPTSMSFVAKEGFISSSAGYVGVSDGWQDLSKNFYLTQNYEKAGPGNVALIAELATPSTQNSRSRAEGSREDWDVVYDWSIGFGATIDSAYQSAQTSLYKNFEATLERYNGGWSMYLYSLEESDRSKARHRDVNSTDTFLRRSGIILKMHEDKFKPGAIVASLSTPAVPDTTHANDENIGGYHLVWPRDLYHTAMGLLAFGDVVTPVHVLRYLESIQKSDGSWSQNNWVDGTPYWQGLQLDEVAFPILLASHLATKKVKELDQADIKMVRMAAEFISHNGPYSQQDRWEEIAGFIPSTIAAQIAALTAAAEILGDSYYSQVAQSWSDNLERWTIPNSTGTYMRVSPSGDPNHLEPINIANGSGFAYAHEIMDGGFLELVRLGVRSAKDQKIEATIGRIEQPSIGIAKYDSAHGAYSYRRYNRDGYGPDHVGGYWPLLGGEKGHYWLARGNKDKAIRQFELMISQALPSGTLPEQVGDHSAGLGVAAPLAWAHAEALLLNRSIEDGKIFDSPADRSR